jgi:hypothetical protein
VGGEKLNYLDVDPSGKAVPYQPPKESKWAKLKNPQMSTTQTRYDAAKGRVPHFEDGVFTPTEYKSTPYSTAVSYLKAFPFETRKKGFGNGGPPARDEFISSTIRGECWRKAIEKETDLLVSTLQNKGAADADDRTPGTPGSVRSSHSLGARGATQRSFAGTTQAQVAQRLDDTRPVVDYGNGRAERKFHYDTIRGDDAGWDGPRANITLHNPKRERRLGPHVLSSATWGEGLSS